jgi:hypothetical protein
VARRRIVLMLALLVIVAGGYVALGLNSVTTYSAEAVMVVPAVTAGQLPPGDPDAAAKLAKTYATAVPLNRDLMTAAAAKAGTDADYVSAHLKMTNDLGTSVMRLTYEGESPQSTAAVLGYVSSRLINTNPPPPVISGSVKLVAVPDSVVAHGGSVAGRVPLGLVLGLVAAFGVAYVLETTRPRIDSVLECADALSIPISEWDTQTVRGLDPLFTRLTVGDPGANPQIEVVGADGRSAQDLPDLVRQIAALAWHHRVSRAQGAAPVTQALALRGVRNDGSAQPVGVVPGSMAIVPPSETAPAAVIVVVRRGTPRSAALLAAKRLVNQGRPASWGVLAPALGYRDRRAARAAG